MLDINEGVILERTVMNSLRSCGLNSAGWEEVTTPVCWTKSSYTLVQLTTGYQAIEKKV